MNFKEMEYPYGKAYEKDLIIAKQDAQSINNWDTAAKLFAHHIIQCFKRAKQDMLDHPFTRINVTVYTNYKVGHETEALLGDDTDKARAALEKIQELK